MHAHRLNAYELAPAAYECAASRVEAYLHQTTLGPQLIELVKMRASQINGCAYCLDMHSKDAAQGRRDRAAHLSAQCLARIAALSRARERAALAWTDALTRIAETQAPGRCTTRCCGAFSTTRSSSI